MQPVQHRSARRAWRLTAGKRDLQQGASDAVLILPVQRREAKKGWRHMQRRRQKRRGADTKSPAGLVDERHAFIETDFVPGPDAAVEIREIGATSQGDVLAIIDLTAVGKKIGSGAPAQMRPLLKQSNAQARVS